MSDARFIQVVTQISLLSSAELKYHYTALTKVPKIQLIFWCENFVVMQCSRRLGRIARNTAKTVRFHNISTTRNEVECGYLVQ